MLYWKKVFFESAYVVLLPIDIVSHLYQLSQNRVPWKVQKDVVTDWFRELLISAISKLSQITAKMIPICLTWRQSEMSRLALDNMAETWEVTI